MPYSTPNGSHWRPSGHHFRAKEAPKGYEPEVRRASPNRSAYHFPFKMLVDRFFKFLVDFKSHFHKKRRTCNVQRPIFHVFFSCVLDSSSHFGSIFCIFLACFCIDSSYIVFALQCATSHFQLLFSNLFSILAPTSAPFLCTFGIFLHGFVRYRYRMA